jgi:hypothetical protein
MTQLPLASATALAGPKYSPAQLDFGTVDYKASAQRTFSLTAPSAGLITLQLSRGGFMAVGMRRVPPAQGTIQMQRPAPSKPTPVLVNDFYRVYEWNLAAGEEIQLDLAFTPSDLNDPSPGPRSETLMLSGSGNHPWHVNIPLRGAVAGGLAQVNPPVASSVQGKKSGPASPSSTALGTVAALPTPISRGQAPPPLGSAPISNTPIHAPDQFDFGEVWDGDLVKKTFSLTANGSGTIHMELPAGPFRVAEIREMGPMGGSKNPGGQSPMLGQAAKNRVKFSENQPGPYTYNLGPGGEIQVDVYFQPHFKFGSEMAGQKNATLKVTGPGPKFNWTLSIPLRGMFDGLKLSATIYPQPKELYAFAGDKVLPVNLTLYGLDNDITGTVKLGDNPPPGVSLTPKSLPVLAKQKNMYTTWLSLSNFQVDGTARPLELIFDDGSKKSKSVVQLIGLPNSRTFSSGNLTDCGIGDLHLTVSIRAPQHTAVDQRDYIPDLDAHTGIPGSLKYQMQGSLNFVVKDYLMSSLWLVVESDGIPIFNHGFDFREHADHVTETQDLGLDLPVETWKRVLNGQARVGCQLSAYWTSDLRGEDELHTLCIQSGGCTEWKWAPVH